MGKFAAVIGVLFTLALPVLMVPVIFLVIFGGGAVAGCAPAGPVTYTGAGVGDLTLTQMQRAAAVVHRGRQMGIPDQGIVIALATAAQESWFRVYANDGKGGDLGADQRGIEASLNLPHDVVGTDHGSLGVFQQQWPWWGTMSELMDPQISTTRFYDALVKVGGWQSLPLTVAAQRVQRSAFPDAYARHEGLARGLLAVIDTAPAGSAEDGEGVSEIGAPAGGLEAEVINGVYVGGFTDCLLPVAAATGEVGFPLPPGSGYINQNNFGQSGPNWSRFHTGNDYSVACGTPVLAATGGTVEFDGAQARWAGPNFVKIAGAGPGSLATWYAHMSSRTVTAGQTVAAGHQIGTVGALGNSSGCHLHFEVHPRGGEIYEDPIDPVAWLAANLGKASTGQGEVTGSSPGAAAQDQPGQDRWSSPAAPAPAPPAAGADTVTVLTQDVTTSAGAGMEALADELAASGATVVALQGVRAAESDVGAGIQQLARRLRMQFAYPVPGETGRAVDTAILSKHPIVDADITDLAGPVGLPPRGLLRVTVDLEPAGLIEIYATHLPADDPAQARTIRSEIGPPACTSVLLGSVHSTPGSEVLRALTTDLRDSFADDRFGPGLTSPAGQPTDRFAYVLHDPGSSATAAAVMPAGSAQDRAVRVTLRIDADRSCG